MCFACFCHLFITLSGDSYRKLVTLADATTCLLEVLDVAGEEEYSAIKDQNTRTAQGFLVIYSITDTNSFDELMVNIEKILRVKDLDYVPMVIMGNKCDLESGRQVETQAGEKVAAMYNAVMGAHKFFNSSVFGKPLWHNLWHKFRINL